MKILGISGLDNSARFKRESNPDLDARELRICQGLDSAAALVVDGEIVAAAAEERFSRKKHTGEFPIGAIQYCLAEGGLSLGDIDCVAHGFDYFPYERLYTLSPDSADLYHRVFSRGALLDAVDRHLPGFPHTRVAAVDHHTAHAASAYLTSGFDECLVVVADGLGEAHGMTVFHASPGELRRLYAISAMDSIGLLYSVVTLHLGFDFNSDEYKIMGLAPYGDPDRCRAFFHQAVTLSKDGGIRIAPLRLNCTPAERLSYSATRRHLQDRLIPAREPESEITAQHCDVAAALQECLDRVMLHVCRHFAAATGMRRLAMAGGVALNCTANGKLLRSGAFDVIHVQPAAGDDGTSLGAALFTAMQSGEARNRHMPAPFLGPAHDIEPAIRRFEARTEAVRFPDVRSACAEAARLIAAGAVIGWYRGRMEFGPRALGHRSILADPSDPAMRDRINAMVKMREAFRPFAPAATVEKAHLWFETEPDAEFRYMIANVDVRPEFRDALPAVTHVNGSARLQTVSVEDNPEFHCLLQEFGKLTGKEIVLNTSFNVKGQPIVNTPEEAIETFLGTGIDILFLENVLLRRRGD